MQFTTYFMTQSKLDILIRLVNELAWTNRVVYKHAVLEGSHEGISESPCEGIHGHLRRPFLRAFMRESL
jgi:hypothetical protein